MSPATGGTTATTLGARDHARAQAGTLVTTMPVLPASAWPAPPEGVDPDRLTWAETVAGGGYTTLDIARGTTVRLRDLQGDACAHVLLWHADRPWERLNVADTVKVLWQAYLTTGHLLLSDQGRVLATLTADTSGRHDAFCGAGSAARAAARYGGDGGAHGAAPAGRALQVLAAAKHGLSPRDVPPSLSFFQGVQVEADGALRFTGSAGPDRSVELRAELDLVVAIVNVPHPLDPREEYTVTPLEVLAWSGEPTGPDDPLWSATPEGERALLNTAAHVTARRPR